MNRGDVLAFKKNKFYPDWKFFRAIETLTSENRNDEEEKEQTGAKLYIVGNVLKKDETVEKFQKLFISEFFELAQAGKANVANEADTALLFLTNKDF